MKGFLMYAEWEEHFSLLSDSESGALVKALIGYCSRGCIPDTLTGAAKMAFSFMKAQIDRDAEKYEDACERNRSNGRKGGRPKKPPVISENPKNPPVTLETERFSEKPKKPNEKENENDNDNFPPIVPQGDDAVSKTNPEQGESLTVETARGSGEEPVGHSTTPVMERFVRFWEAYPRKVGKGAAEKAWRKLKPSETLTDDILSAIAAQKKSRQWLRDGGQYIPNPATWLTQRRWEDDLQERVEANTPKALQTSYDLDEWDRETVTVPGFGDSGP